MKHIALVFLSLLLSLFVAGQTIQDKQSVIQKSIDFEALQSCYSNKEFEGKQQLFIVNNRVVPANLELLKFGNKVTFMKKEDMFFKNIRNHIDFMSFTIDTAKADVKFHYGLNGPTIYLEFEKDNDDWKLIRSDLKK